MLQQMGMTTDEIQEILGQVSAMVNWKNNPYMADEELKRLLMDEDPGPDQDQV